MAVLCLVAFGLGLLANWPDLYKATGSRNGGIYRQEYVSERKGLIHKYEDGMMFVCVNVCMGACQEKGIELRR